jgi:hypothetical protein
MQVVEPFTLASSQLSVNASLLLNLGRANISRAGCKWLSKVNWK